MTPNGRGEPGSTFTDLQPYLDLHWDKQLSGYTVLTFLNISFLFNRIL